MGEYLSGKWEEIDPVSFFHQFNVNILGISRACDISRSSISKMPSFRAAGSSTRRIVEYLEEVSIEDYAYTLDCCREELAQALKKIDKAWEQYEEKERILDEYRLKYGIDRKLSYATYVPADTLLEEVIR